LVGLATAAANADEPPTRIFHIGIIAGSLRSDPTNVAFKDRLRELGYVEGRNLTIDFVRDNDPDRMAAAVDELARRGVDVIALGNEATLKAAVTGTGARSTPVQGSRFRPAGKRLHRQPFPSGRQPDRGGL
jgi:hypothetical protein